MIDACLPSMIDEVLPHRREMFASAVEPGGVWGHLKASSSARLNLRVLN
jgi:hypothetical protein